MSHPLAAIVAHFAPKVAILSGSLIISKVRIIHLIRVAIQLLLSVSGVVMNTNTERIGRVDSALRIAGVSGSLIIYLVKTTLTGMVGESQPSVSFATLSTRWRRRGLIHPDFVRWIVWPYGNLRIEMGLTPQTGKVVIKKITDLCGIRLGIAFVKETKRVIFVVWVGKNTKISMGVNLMFTT